MEKRLIIAIVLSFLVLFGYQALFNKANKPAPKPPVPTEAAAVPAVPGTAGQAPIETRPAAVETKPAPAAPAPSQAAVAGKTESDIVVETPLYRAVWTNKGGVLKSWVLKEHMTRARGNGLSRFFDKFFGRQAPKEPAQPLDLVPALAAETGRFPFSVGLDDAALTGLLNGSLFDASTASLDLADGVAQRGDRAAGTHATVPRPTLLLARPISGKRRTRGSSA